MVETWRNIGEYNGVYQISNTGKVKSFNRGSAKLLTPSNRGGYEIVTLQINNVKKSHSIHRLVADAFIYNLNNYPEVNHRDEVKNNNHVDNLEWCTKEYNMQYGTLGNRISKSLSKTTYQYDLEYNLIKIWSSTRDAGKNGYSYGHIGSCCRGERKTHKGYIWKYEEDVINGK